MTIAFTICSNNYLAHASVLIQSFKKFHSDIPIYLCIVDELKHEISYDDIGADGVIDVPQIIGDQFFELASKFTLTELCTAVTRFD